MSKVAGNTLGVAQISVFAVFQTLITVSCALRFWARSISGVRLALNDYLILSAWFWTSAIGVCAVLSVVLGAAGRHMDEGVTHANILALQKLFVPGAFFWALANTSVKLSMLHFYTKLFSSPQFGVFKRVVQIIAVLTLCYCTVIILETFLLCRPFAFNWDKTIANGYCANIHLAYFTAGLINLVLDVAIVALPLPMLWNLQLPIFKKFGIMFMLSIGIFICIITVLRLLAIRRLDFTNFTYTACQVQMWSILEPQLGIINACLPLMLPGIRRLFCMRNPETKKTGSAPSGVVTIGGSGYSSHNDKRRFRRLQEDSYRLQTLDDGTIRDLDDEIVLATVSEERLVGKQAISTKGGIRVKTETSVVSARM